MIDAIQQLSITFTGGFAIYSLLSVLVMTGLAVYEFGKSGKRLLKKWSAR